QSGVMANASSRHRGISGILPYAAVFAAPSARHSERRILPAAEPAATNASLVTGGTKPAIAASHLGFDPRWHIRFTVGFQPPETPTVSHFNVEPSASSTPETIFPPSTLVIVCPRRTLMPDASAFEPERLSIIASTPTP